MNPLVSVIVPVFNCERFLAEALQSIFAQDYRPLEVIVVDDGSTDGSADVALTFPEVILIRQPNGGVSSARNAGVAAARGDLIAWLDADDFWLPGKLSREVEHLAQNEATGITLCHQRMFVNSGDPEPPWLKSSRGQKGISHSLYASTMRRELFDQVGTFDLSLRTGEDFDWYLRARAAGARMDIIDEVLVVHRVRPGSLMGDRPRARQDLLLVASMAMKRRRAGQDDPPAKPD